MNTDALRGLEPMTSLWSDGVRRCRDRYNKQELRDRLALYESLVPALLAERDALKERCEKEGHEQG